MDYQIESLTAQINTSACREIPFIGDATETVIGYINGGMGPVVLLLGVTALVMALFNEKALGQLFGKFGRYALIPAAVLALPVIMAAFGVDLSCSGSTNPGGSTPPPATVPAPEENA